jgi:hypothetical protein
MIEFVLLWGLPLFAGLAGATLALVLRERTRSAAHPPFELVRVKNATLLDLESYFEALTRFSKEAHRSILIVDYLAHHGSLKGDAVFKLYKRYFQEIEAVVREKGLTYTRIVQLPLSRIARNRNQKIIDGLSLMFVETFDHIERMLNSTADFNLYFLDAAFRPYSFIIVDESAILTEYDRYTPQGTSVADHTIINRAVTNSPSTLQVSSLIAIQKGWCDRLTLNEREVTKEEFSELKNQMENRRLKEVELQLSLSDTQYRNLRPQLDEDAILGERFHGPEAVKKNLQGTQKKLETVGVAGG